MADSRLLQAGINDERFKALLELLDRQAEIDLSVVDVIDVDNVDASALVHLADQYNVLGYRGWLLCETEEAKRNLIKESINLHRYSGTSWAIETAIQAVGFDGAEVIENPGSSYNGVIDYDAEEVHDGRLWGAFIVNLNAGDGPLSNARVLLVGRLIEEWKNVRSHLLRLIAFRPLLHTGHPVGLENIHDGHPNGADNIYDASYNHDGSIDPTQADDIYDASYNHDGSIDYTRPFTLFYTRPFTLFYDGFIDPTQAYDIYDASYNHDGSIDYTRPFTFFYTRPFTVFYNGDYQYDGFLNRVE